MQRSMMIILACVMTSAAYAATPQDKVKWLGTAPFCKGDVTDCADRDWVYIGPGKAGDGSPCVSGHKVLCGRFSATKYKYFRWIGTAPFCNGVPKDCTDKGGVYLGDDTEGDGAACATGRKVVCGFVE